ncbi:hypothetical protein AB1Y20_022375 [Prymnesium parvum]|uniref:Amidophosphoribosyltransferase n=1 Tax=Prymnesium parvum TaxID=97485 RepID=A0AB34JIM6_PRYPA
MPWPETARNGQVSSSRRRDIMCGITGVLCGPDSPSNAAVALLYDALLALQHRGQDAAGIVTEDAGRLCLRKDTGMVRDVFTPDHVLNLRGDMGIGHVRYPTAGSSCSAEAQPFYVNSPYGITLAHNGNLVNAHNLQAELAQEYRHINTGSDSEVLLNVLASELLNHINARVAATHGDAILDPLTRMTPQACTLHLHALPSSQRTFPTPRTRFAVVAMITGWGLLALRDPNGIRPLCYGKRAISTKGGGQGFDHEFMVTSESGALNALGFELEGDVPPGHALVVTRDGKAKMFNCMPPEVPMPVAPCIFEYVYFARPDSVLDGISVYRTRLRMGAYLARKILKEWPDHDIDVVIPVPDTSRTCALECAATLGIKYREGFIKNRYVGRTFIMPAQACWMPRGLRKKSVRQKLSPISSEFQARNILLVDDSIVRGTTAGQIIQMVRDAGAKKVYMASAAPPVKYPNVYGIDMPTKEELLAHRHSNMDAIAHEIGADRVIYQDLGDLERSILDESKASNSYLKGLDCSCFNGIYVTELGTDYLANLARSRTFDRGDAVAISASNSLDTLQITANGRKSPEIKVNIS